MSSLDKGIAAMAIPKTTYFYSLYRYFRQPTARRC